MEDNLWEVQGVDPDLRRRAVEEARRRGQSLTAYLTEILLNGGGSEGAARSGSADNARRRLAASARRLDDGLAALGGAADDLSGEAIQCALREIQASVAVLERNADQAHAALDSRLGAVAASVEAIEAGQDALKQALASDFIEFADNAAAHIDASLAAAAQRAADQEERMAALGQRIAAQDEAAARTAGALLDRAAETERAVKSSIQTLSSAQRKLDTSLTSELAKLAYETRSAIDAVRTDIGEAGAQRDADRARIDHLDTALDRTAGELAVVRNYVEEGFARSTEHQAQIQRHLTRIHADWDSRFDALTARLARVEQEAEQSRGALTADSERIEACTFAALQKLHADIAAVRSASAAFDGEARGRLESVASAQIRMSERLAMLEDAASRADTEQALSIIRGQIAALAEAQRGAEQHALGPTLGQGAADAPAANASISAVEEQLTRLEQRQALALDMLREQIALFASENEQRLVLLESSTDAGRDVDMLAFRLARLEQRDAEADLQALRNRLEDRMQELEARNIRAIERLGESIAEIERRMLSVDQGLDVKSA